HPARRAARVVRGQLTRTRHVRGPVRGPSLRCARRVRGKGETVPGQTYTTPVLIVGAGPVGAVLALELARHNVSSMVVERSQAASTHPKMDYLSGRSMELLRRLGLAQLVR